MYEIAVQLLEVLTIGVAKELVLTSIGVQLEESENHKIYFDKLFNDEHKIVWFLQAVNLFNF